MYGHLQIEYSAILVHFNRSNNGMASCISDAFTSQTNFHISFEMHPVRIIMFEMINKWQYIILHCISLMHVFDMINHITSYPVYASKQNRIN